MQGGTNTKRHGFTKKKKEKKKKHKKIKAYQQLKNVC